MKLFCLSDRDAATVIASVKDPVVKTILLAQLNDPLTGGSGRPRTVLLRDEGNGVGEMLVNYDDPREADTVWLGLCGDAEEDAIAWPD